MSMIRTDTDGAVRHVIFAREEKRNAMNMEFIAQLDSALLEAQNDDSINCVVIRGDGPMFSAGIDIESLNDFSGGLAQLRPMREHMIRALNRCEEMTKPVLLQAHGAVIGMAMELALACDMRICTEETVWSLPEVKIGLIPDVGGSSRLPAIVGLGRAKELIMTGKFIDGREAERIGLANRAVPAGELEDATSALVTELLACAPVAVGLAKRVLDSVARPTLAASLEFEVTAQTVCAATEDFVEGATAVKERRQPQFKGH
ncbi:MAG: enoyl-CoA hydratase/isomerase family protein [Actinomycetes bacterium]